MGGNMGGKRKKGTKNRRKEGREGTSELWVLRGVVEGLRVLVGLRVWSGRGEGRGLILGKGVMVCAEHRVWLVL